MQSHRKTRRGENLSAGNDEALTRNRGQRPFEVRLRRGDERRAQRPCGKRSVIKNDSDVIPTKVQESHLLHRPIRQLTCRRKARVGAMILRQVVERSPCRCDGASSLPAARKASIRGLSSRNAETAGVLHLRDSCTRTLRRGRQWTALCLPCTQAPAPEEHDARREQHAIVSSCQRGSSFGAASAHAPCRQNRLCRQAENLKDSSETTDRPLTWTGNRT